MLNGAGAEVHSAYFLSLDKTFCSIFLIFNYFSFFSGSREVLTAALGDEVKITSTQITLLTAALLVKQPLFTTAGARGVPREERARCSIDGPAQGIPSRLLSEGTQDPCVAPTLAVQ